MRVHDGLNQQTGQHWLEFNKGNFMRPLRAVRAVLMVCFCVALRLSAQTSVGSTVAATTLSGLVLDPSGAAIPNAALHLHSASTDRDATSDGAGHFAVSVPAATYDLTVFADGFRPLTRSGVNVVSGRNTALNVTLKIATDSEEVDVSVDSVLSTDQASNKSALVFSGDKLDQFSDDPAVMTEQLNALGGIDPSEPPQLYVDGFSGGALPPKESIREIRINQNPFSSMYDSFGLGRIEIFTKPGANKLHGDIAGNWGSSALNARNPFAGAQPEYLNSYSSADLNGPIGKASSFFFSGNRVALATNAAINATTLAPDNVSAVSDVAVVAATSLNQTYSLRFDRQFGATDTFIAKYIFAQAKLTNAGIGQLVLPSEAYNSDTRTQTLQVTDTHIFNPKIVLDSAFQYVRTRLRQDAVSTAPARVVQGSFSDGGNPAQALHDDLDRFEFRGELSIVHDKHFIRTGGRYRLTRDANLATAGYNGQFTFPSFTAFQITEQGVALGESDATIRATCKTDSSGNPVCGGATQLAITAGQPSASLITGDLGVYAEDEWKRSANLTLNYGFRVESQSAIPDHLDFGPRVGFAYSLKRNAKAKDPLLVFRGGFGIFYQRFASANILTSIRQNGVTQQSYQLANPSSDTYSPNSAAAPSVAGLSAVTPTIYEIDPHLRSPTQMQGMFSGEHSFGKYGSLSVAYYRSRGTHQLDSVNINAPLPNGSHPLGSAQNVYQFSSGGIRNGQTLGFNPNINVSKRLSMWAFAGIQHQESDAFGATSFVSNSHNLSADAGPFTGYYPRQLFAGFNAKPGWDTQLNYFMAVRSHTYFNITTGADNNSDSIYNDRPAFATAATPAASLVKTAYGNFDINPQPGETIIPVNYGNAPGMVYTEMYFNKNFRWGPRPPAPVAPPAAGGTTTPAKPVAKEDLPPPRYRLQIGIGADNLLNHFNRAAPVGILTSPEFGQSISLNYAFTGNPAANRSVLLRTAFFF